MFYYRHKVLRIPGAYTTYSFFEWNLIIQDLLFDFCSLYDLSRLEIHVSEAPHPQTQISQALGGSWWTGGAHQAVKEGAWSTPITGSSARMTTRSASSATRSASTPEATTLDDSKDSDDEQGKGHHTIQQSSTSPSSARAVFAFVSECYLAFLWWTTLTALHPSIFFFSVYNLSIGGHEILLIVQVFALAITLLPPIRKRLLERGTATFRQPSSSRWLLLMHSLTLLSIATWWIPGPLVRLALTGLANVFAAVLQVVQFGQAAQSGDIDNKTATWLLGLIFSSLAKYANHSNNPLWPFMNSSNGGYHVVGLAVAAIALAEAATRPSGALIINTPPPMPREQVKKSSSLSASILQEVEAAVGMGALLFALHTFLTDSGSMITWSWTGYPVKGPMSITHGWVILAAMAAGISPILVAPRWIHKQCLVIFIAYTCSNLVLLFYSDYISFAGAVGTALTLPSLTVPIVSNALPHGVSNQKNPLKVMLYSWLVADLLTFAQVLTVAYAFVPGGKPFRERTWVMLLVQATCLGVGLQSAWRRRVSAGSSLPSLPMRNTSAHKLVKRAFFTLLAATAVLGWTIAQIRTVNPKTIKPYQADTGSRVFTVGIQTVHFGLDQLFYDSSRRMSDLYKDLQLDVFGLLESDLQRSVFGNRDLTQWLAEDLKMYADIGPGPDKHTWGAALFSKFPILESKHHLLPSPHGELAPAIHAVLDVYGQRVHVWVSHNGQEEDPLDRAMQTDTISREAAKVYPEPFVFLGYLVTKAHAPSPSPYGILFGEKGDDGKGLGRILDVEPLDNMRWCQYIGFRALERVGYARISRYTLTDTELQTAKFRVPSIGETVNPDRDVRPRLVNDYEVPSDWHYPNHYIDPDALVYEKFKFSPWIYPRYYREALD
ncbi:unnamed protein product [Sympodiomycopsis kandeliae]